jgi:RNA polymerase sigma-70 factor (ECF subfamily)
MAESGAAGGRAGEGSEFARLALPHLDAAYNLARWLLRDPVAAEDVVQDAMLRALTYFASFRGTNARAWLLQIVRNAAHDRLAAGARAREVPLMPFDDEDEAPVHEPADPADDPEAALSRRQDRAALGEALAALPVELRECLVLRELEEMSYRDIAQVTGVPVGTVMSRLWRARRALLRSGEAPA